jgi:site-specific DNA-methyltransferase (adenine-specific)
MTMTQLLLGDCLKLLRDIGPVDTVITDPVWPNVPPGLLEGWQAPADLLADALALVDAKRIVIVTRYDSDPRFLSAVPARWPFFRVQTLKYAVPGYNGRKLGGYEYAYSFGEPVKSRPGRRVIPGEGPTITRPTPPNGHPCPRSVGHFRWLVNWWSEPGETVLDPFMGSGTTALACYELGRSFIGMEIDPTYHAIAMFRVAQAQQSPQLFEAKS